MWRRSARLGAVALAISLQHFCRIAFTSPVYGTQRFLGYRAAVYIVVLVSVCQQIILFVAAVMVWDSLAPRGWLSQRAALIARWAFGLCSVVFGVAHLTAMQTVVAMIPKWMPLGGGFWAVFTGVAFVLGGLAIVSGVLDVLAARLLGLMLLFFSALVLAPMIFPSPRDHVAWGANAYNLTALGAAWIVAEWLASSRFSRRNQNIESLCVICITC